MKSYTHFTLFDRICLQEMLKSGKKFSEIADLMGRSKSTISRELKRNSNSNGVYNPYGAESKANIRRKNSVRKPRILKGSRLYNYIVEKLNLFWSPELIATMWNKANPDDTIAFTTIYNAVRKGYFEGITTKNNLRRRNKKYCGKRNKFNTIHPDHTIHERPQEVNERKVFGHWEGDTVRGPAGKGGLLTLIERKSLKLIAIKVNNFSAQTLHKAMLQAFNKIHPKSITLDNGSEFAKFRDIEKDLNTIIYFADPHSPWQRGSNENINGVLRFFFPKGQNFLPISQEDIDMAVALINSRPRFCLDLLTPDEVFCCT